MRPSFHPLALIALSFASIGSFACTHHTVVTEHAVSTEETCAKTACDAAEEAALHTARCKECFLLCAENFYCDDPRQHCAVECPIPACEDATRCAE